MTNTIYFQSILTGLTCALAFYFPETIYSVGLGWISALLLCHITKKSEGSYKIIYLSGVVAHIFGFYWLVNTISNFGNFPYWAAILIYLLFALSNSLFFLVLPLIYKSLPATLDNFFLRIPIAWSVAEFIPFRIFPWHYGHTQLAFLQFVQIADIAGAIAVTFVMFWIASLLEELISKRNFRWQIIFPLLILVTTLVYGTIRIEHFENLNNPAQKIAVIQGNIPIQEKHSQSQFKENIDTYVNLGKAYEDENTLIIWPETIIMAALPTNITKLKSLPFLSPIPKWLIGTLMVDENGAVYNSALAISNGSMAFDAYHKMILMPFGEYAPFSKTFPWLLELAHMEGQLTPGTNLKIINYETGTNTPPFKVAPLICYEDLVAAMGRKATLLGANVLVNITNDAWFGNTAAPYQHNGIAAFRALENRRFLIRAANTGLSSVIAPTGKTLSQTKPFMQGTLVAEVQPITELSLYTKTIGDSPWWGLSILSVFFIVFSFLKKGSAAKSNLNF